MPADLPWQDGSGTHGQPPRARAAAHPQQQQQAGAPAAAVAFSDPTLVNEHATKATHAGTTADHKYPHGVVVGEKVATETKTEAAEQQSGSSSSSSEGELLDIDHMNCFRRWTMRFCNPILAKGVKQPLEVNDVWTLPLNRRGAALKQRFEQEWNSVTQEHKQHIQAHKRELARRKMNDTANAAKRAFHADATQHQTTEDQHTAATNSKHKETGAAHSSSPKQHQQDPADNNNNDHNDDQKPHSPNLPYPLLLGRVFYRLFGRRWIFAGFLHVIATCFMLITPLLILHLVRFLSAYDNGQEESKLKGYLLAAGVMCSNYGGSLFINRMFAVLVDICALARSTAMGAVYEKALRMTTSARQGSTIGGMVNLLSNDSIRLFEGGIFLHFLWIAPLTLIGAFTELFFELGWTAIAGVAVALLMMPFQIFMFRLIGRNRRSMIKYTDERVNLASEILQGIKVVKLYAWEPAFADVIHAVRNNELKRLRVTLYIQAIMLGVSFVSPAFIAMFALGAYAIAGNEITLPTTFAVLAIANTMRFVVFLLPMSINAYAEARVSARRIGAFLLQDELPPRPDAGCEPRGGISVQQASFAWDAATFLEGPEFCVPTLKNISFRIKPGSLVAIVGRVGVGKSSVLSAILGEIPRLSGEVHVNGNMALVSQQPFIRNASVRDNIISQASGDYDEALYERAVEASALLVDIEVLPSGDMTEVGARGINLSGGQKSRIAIAHALYNCHKSDIFLFDDPFASVDVEVGAHIFKRALKEMLRDKTCIVVMSSHLHLLSEFDEVIVLGSDALMPATPMDGTDTSAHVHNGLDKVTRLATFELKAASGIIRAQGSPDSLKEEFASIMASTDDDVSVDGAGLEHNSGGGSPQKAKNRRQGMVSSVSRALTTFKSGGIGSNMTKAEKRETGSVRLGVAVAYFDAAYVGHGVLVIFLVLLLYTLAQVTRVGADLWVSAWADKRWFADEGTGFWLGLWFAWMVVTTLAAVARSFVFAELALRASRELHDRLFRGFLRAPMSFFDVTPLGQLQNKLARDVDITDNQLSNFLGNFLQNSFILFGSVVLIVIAAPWFMILLVPLVFVFYKIQLYFRVSSRELKRLASISQSPVLSLFSETLNGLSTIRAYGMTGPSLQRFMKLLDVHTRCFYCIKMTQRWIGLNLDFVSGLIIGSVAFFAVYLTIDGKGDVALFALAIVYSTKFMGLLQWTVRTSIESENALVAVERLLSVIDIPREAAYTLEASRKHKSSGPSNATALMPPIMASGRGDNNYAQWPGRGEIEFRNVKMRYRDGLPLVLKGVSFRAMPRAKVGICGRTGAGKSSMTLILFRLVELAEGAIFIDGVDISKLGLKELRSAMSMVPQDPVFFTTNIRRNLDPFSSYSDAMVWEVLERVHMAKHIRSMPRGLESHVTEGGENLSQGQRQLLCIGRALLRRSRIIIMDEATSSIDAETDGLIQKTIRENFRDCTVLTIAHRLETVMDSDMIVVLEGGHLAQYASPSQLLASVDAAEQSEFARIVEDVGPAALARLRTIAHGRERPSFSNGGLPGENGARAVSAHSRGPRAREDSKLAHDDVEITI